MSKGASVVIATYNGATYLREQLRSILEQLSDNDELLIADDCSTDGSIEILEEYQKAHCCIKLIKNEYNIGVRATFEKLLHESSKEIIILSDQDDVWLENRKYKMIDLIEKSGCLAVLTNSLVFTEHGIQRMFFPEGCHPDVRSTVKNYIKNNFIGCCMAFRREVLEVALPFPTSISMHDWWIGSCAIALGEVRYIPEPSLLYRRHSNNQSAGRRRPWRVVAKDRVGNLFALTVLLSRLGRSHRVRKQLRN